MTPHFVRVGYITVTNNLQFSCVKHMRYYIRHQNHMPSTNFYACDDLDHTLSSLDLSETIPEFLLDLQVQSLTSLLLDLLVQSLTSLSCYWTYWYNPWHLYYWTYWYNPWRLYCYWTYWYNPWRLLLDLLVQSLTSLSYLRRGRRGHSKIYSCILYMLSPKYIFTTYGRASSQPCSIPDR